MTDEAAYEVKLYRIPVYKLMCVRDGSSKAPYNKFEASNSQAAAEIVSAYLDGADREHFVVLLLNAKNKVIGINTVSTGTLTACLIHPREIFKAAILANAHAIILAHNHPSCDPTPSREDKELTQRLINAGELLGIHVLDHVIVAGERHHSLRDSGAAQFKG